MSMTRPRRPGLSPFSSTSMWSCTRKGRVVRISTLQKMLDSTLQAAKNATAATAVKPVKAVHSTLADTPSRPSATMNAET